MSRPPTYLIAEMACSHEGDPALARTIVDAAGRAGADAVQFQMWRAEDIVVPGYAHMPALRRLELSPGVWHSLAAYVRERHRSLAIIACVYDEHALALGEAIGADAYKLHGGDIANPRLIRAMARTGKRIDLSVGGAGLDEVKDAIALIRATSASPIWLMVGYQAFPTAVDDAHIRYLATLRDLFGLPVGYQDHTDADHPGAFWLPAAAMGAGVEILEKHITHDRSRKGADHEAALNPDEFARFAGMVRTLDRALGSARPRPFSESERRYREYARKSLVAARAVAAGETIADADLLALRADTLGLPPAAREGVVGRRARRALAAHEPIRDEDLA